jgi:hypothetical protein
MKSIAQKLGLGEGMNLALINAPRADILGETPSLVGTDHEPQLPAYDAIIIFATSFAEMRTFVDGAIGSYKPKGLLWLCYPKLTSKLAGDLNRNELMNFIEDFRPVTQVALDDDWSAMRFRRHEEVGS